MPFFVRAGLKFFPVVRNTAAGLYFLCNKFWAVSSKTRVLRSPAARVNYSFGFIHSFSLNSAACVAMLKVVRRNPISKCLYDVRGLPKI
jgi:hypothetical protein